MPKKTVQKKGSELYSEDFVNIETEEDKIWVTELCDGTEIA